MAHREADRLVQTLQQSIDPAWEVQSAFLEIDHPRLGNALQEAAQRGASEILVFPVFLNTGNHVANDIPQIVKSAQTAYPEIQFRLAPHLGSAANFSTFLSSEVQKQIAETL